MIRPTFREVEVETDASRRQTTRLQARFLKGPIALSDLWTAGRLPGQALALYLVIRHQSDLTGSPVVTTPAGLLKRFGIDKDAKSRALKSLLGANLITLDQRPGKSTRIALTTSIRARNVTP
jgi:DNA-binding transcriptional ArsR family regulator